MHPVAKYATQIMCEISAASSDVGTLHFIEQMRLEMPHRLQFSKNWSVLPMFAFKWAPQQKHALDTLNTSAYELKA